MIYAHMSEIIDFLSEHAILDNIELPMLLPLHDMAVVMESEIKNQRSEIHLGHGHKRGPKCFLYLWSSSGNLLYIFAFTATIQRI